MAARSSYLEETGVRVGVTLRFLLLLLVCVVVSLGRGRVGSGDRFRRAREVVVLKRPKSKMVLRLTSDSLV